MINWYFLRGYYVKDDNVENDVVGNDMFVIWLWPLFNLVNVCI